MFDELIETLEARGEDAVHSYPDPATFQREIRKKDKDLTTLLMYAINKGKANAIATLVPLLYVHDFRAQDKNGQTALHWAVKKRDLQAIKTILNAIPNEDLVKVVNVTDESGDTPLHLASLHDEENDIVKEFLARAEQANVVDALLLAQDTRQNTPLHLAAGKGNKNVVIAILEKKPAVETINAPNNIGETPLIIAVKMQEIDIAESIIISIPIEQREQKVAVIKTKDNSGNNCLFYAYDTGSLDFLNKTLKAFGHDLLSETNVKGDTLFLHAIKKGGAEDLLEDYFEIELLSHKNVNTNETVLKLANQPDHKAFMDKIRQLFNNDYLTKHPNPLVKMYMRFINTQTFKGSRPAQLRHFTSLIEAFSKANKDNQGEFFGVLGSHRFKPSSITFLGSSDLYQSYMTELKNKHEHELVEFFGEFLKFHELMKEILTLNNTIKNDKDKIIGSGFFMNKNWEDTIEKIDSTIEPARALRNEGGPSHS